MNLLREYIRHVIIEASLEDENLFDDYFSSGDPGQITTAYTLAMDSGIDFMNLPWELIPLFKGGIDSDTALELLDKINDRGLKHYRLGFVNRLSKIFRQGASENEFQQGEFGNEVVELLGMLRRGDDRLKPLDEVNLGTGVGIGYTAFVLDTDSAGAFRQYVPEEWQQKSHHMTLISPKYQKQRLPSHWLDFEDNTGQMKVVGVAKNDKVITGLVDLGGLPVPMKGPAFPHVTIAVNPEAGGKAYMSNEFQISDFEPIKPIPITGAVEEILR